MCRLHYLMLTLLALLNSANAILSSSGAREESIFRSGADLIVTDNQGPVHYILEAYKSSLNDRILKDKTTKNYNQLKWFSYGSPQISTINGSAIHFTSNGFCVYIEMLNNRHRRLFREEIKRQYGIDVLKDQIKDLTPATFECTMRLKCYEEYGVWGKVLDLRVFPYRVDFAWKVNGSSEPSDKECMQSNQKENIDFDFECNMTMLSMKPTDRPFKKTFRLRTVNQIRNISFDENILERLSNIEMNLKKLNNLLNNTVNDEYADKLVISETDEEEEEEKSTPKDNASEKVEAKKQLASFVPTSQPTFKGI